MKSFLIIYSQKNKRKLSQELLEKHIDFLKNLTDLKYLVVCGPFIDNERSMIVLRCSSKEIATQLVNEDPFVKEKYYRQYETSEFTEATKQNNWLISDPQTTNNIS